MIHGPLLLEIHITANGMDEHPRKHLLLNYGQVQTVLYHVKRMLNRYKTFEVTWYMADDMGRGYMTGGFDHLSKDRSIFRA